MPRPSLKGLQSAQLSRENGSGNGTNPQRFSANHVGTGKHVSSDEEGSEDLYPEKDISSSSSGSTSHKRHVSLTKRLSLKKSQVQIRITETITTKSRWFRPTEIQNKYWLQCSRTVKRQFIYLVIECVGQSVACG